MFRSAGIRNEGGGFNYPHLLLEVCECRDDDSHYSRDRSQHLHSDIRHVSSYRRTSRPRTIGGIRGRWRGSNKCENPPRTSLAWYDIFLVQSLPGLVFHLGKIPIRFQDPKFPRQDDDSHYGRDRSQHLYSDIRHVSS